MKTNKLIVGNWKMNPSTMALAKDIVKATKSAATKCPNVDVILCPPAIFLRDLSSATKPENIFFGSQYVSAHETGAYTSEISANMLRDAGITHCIVGHSEQRKAGDTDEIVSKKVTQALTAGISPVICVGEKERTDSGDYFDFVKTQVMNACADVSSKDIKDVILAYEPIWAIGAPEPMNPSSVVEMVLFVRKIFADKYTPAIASKIRVIYGGAVSHGNAAEMINIGQVDGFIVGRESINTAGFPELIKVVSNTK
jgi:triosephosphate isomerase